MISPTLQTLIGSAYSSSPVRWIETPEAARSGFGIDQVAGNNVGKPVEKAVDPDLGKPQSASGDVLDLSAEAQQAPAVNRMDARNNLDESKSATEKSEGAVKSEGSGKSERSVRVVGEADTLQSDKELATGKELTPEERQQVAHLQARDQEIRIHEMAHMMAGGQYVTSGPSYQYEIGPDGKAYAVSGSVGIDTSPVQDNPEATIAKMQTVAAAAMAPSQPSGQDYKVAAQARQAEAQARAELSAMKSEELQSKPPQPEEGKELKGEDAGAFSIVRTADRMAEAPKSDAPEEAIMPSLVRSGTEFAPSSAYKAQSSAVQSAPRFTAFA